MEGECHLLFECTLPWSFYGQSQVRPFHLVYCTTFVWLKQCQVQLRFMRWENKLYLLVVGAAKSLYRGMWVQGGE